MGREGCGADCHVRELDGGVRVARGESLCVRALVGEDMVEGPLRADCSFPKSSASGNVRLQKK
jgi:hypothetical protein